MKQVYKKLLEKKYLNPPDKYKCGNKKLILSKNKELKHLDIVLDVAKKIIKKFIYYIIIVFLKTLKIFKLKISLKYSDAL